MGKLKTHCSPAAFAVVYLYAVSSLIGKFRSLWGIFFKLEFYALIKEKFVDFFAQLKI